MNATLDQSPWDGLFPMDAVTPMTSVHQGIEYGGEVVRASRWSSRLKGAPGDGYHFKIVLLQEPPRSGLPDTVHQKTAICVPVPDSGRQVHRIIGEITAAKQAAYLTRRDVDAAAINTALRERRHDLESQLISEESARFSKGFICVHDRPGPDPDAIFASRHPLQWIEGLATWLLARSYPSLPFDTNGLTQLISGDDAGRLFASIFGQAGSDPEVLARLGPALGLLSQDSGGSYDPSGCRVFPLVRAKIGDGPAPFAEVHRFLAYDVGLTTEMASLFLLLFVSHARPEHQIRLKDGAAMCLADGGALLGARLTSDLIPLLAWDSELTSKAAAIGPASAPRFIDARHHLSVLCPELASIGADVAADVAYKALTRSLESIARDIGTASNILKSLEARWDAGFGATEAAGETGKLMAALEQLGRISGSGYADLYHSVRAAYPALPKLKDDLETLRQLVKLDNDAVEIFQAQRYIANTQVPTMGFPNLSVDRDAILTGLSPSRLTRSRGRGWSAVVRDAEGFKIRYTQAYREHHRRFHDELPVFQMGLLEAKKKCAALDLLNTIYELGTPAGTGLEEELAALPPGPFPCSIQGAELDLSNEPFCPECRISLEQAIPSAELARLAPQVDMALGEKTQELSRLMVGKVLAGKTNGRWREFLQIIQASELSSLANTLDSDLVSFIKEVLE